MQQPNANKRQREVIYNLSRRADAVRQSGGASERVANMIQEFTGRELPKVELIRRLLALRTLVKPGDMLILDIKRLKGLYNYDDELEPQKHFYTTLRFVARVRRVTVTRGGFKVELQTIKSEIGDEKRKYAQYTKNVHFGDINKFEDAADVLLERLIMFNPMRDDAFRIWTVETDEGGEVVKHDVSSHETWETLSTEDKMGAYFCDKLNLIRNGNDILRNLIEPNDDECSICYNSLANTKTRICDECRHTFHDACIRQLRQFDNRCPQCRSNLDRKPMRTRSTKRSTASFKQFIELPLTLRKF